MKRLIKILVALFALAGIITSTFFAFQMWRSGYSFNGFGAGDGAGSSDGYTGAALFGFFLMGLIWLLPTSPYLCMAASSLNVIKGKAERAAFIYSLIALLILSLIMALSFQRHLEFIALGNIAAGSLWVYDFQEKKSQTTEKTIEIEPHEG